MFRQRLVVLSPTHETKVVSTRCMTARVALLVRHSLANILCASQHGMIVAEFVLGDGSDLFCRDCVLIADALNFPQA